MKRLIPISLSLMAAFTCMGMLCDMSSHNGPDNYNPIDTTSVLHLDTVAIISISVLVREWDKKTATSQLSQGAAVKFTNNGLVILTDSTGYARTTFSVDSIPFKCSYEVTKDGYSHDYYSGWAEGNALFGQAVIDKIYLDKALSLR